MPTTLWIRGNRAHRRHYPSCNIHSLSWGPNQITELLVPAASHEPFDIAPGAVWIAQDDGNELGAILPAA
jgi:hypothetical protein